MPLILMLSLPFLLGCVCGLRSMAGPAIVCWAAHLGWLHLDGSKLAFLHHPVSLVVFTLLALGELVGDKLPSIPSRILIGPLVVRFVSGTLCGWALGVSMNAGWFPGALMAGMGGLGAFAGAFAGYHLRRWLAVRRGLSDFPVALLEDFVAIGVGFYVVSGKLLGVVVVISGWL